MTTNEKVLEEMKKRHTWFLYLNDKEKEIVQITEKFVLERLKDYWLKHGVYCHRKAHNHAIDKASEIVHIVCCEKCESMIKTHLKALKKEVIE